MKDREFLMWLHARLTGVHNEDPLIDYMHKLRAIIANTPKDLLTPNVGSTTSLGRLQEIIEEVENESRSKN